MSTVEKLLATQKQLINSVSRMLPNFKKLGQAKMTTAVTRQRLTTLKEMFSKCQDLDGEIELLANDKLRATDEYFTERLIIACEDAYYEASDVMAEVLESLEIDSHQTTALNVSSRSELSRATLHLPRINLPTFDGSFAKWEHFRDRFTSMVRNEATLSNVERMHYLCSCVKGDASTAIEHLAITNDNFEVAWQILASRYDNKRRLITIHLQSLFNLPSLSTETSKDLRNLRDHINTPIQALKNLGRTVEHWDDLLVFLVAQKLDKSTRKAWELKLGDTMDYPRYSELDQFLESRIRALEAMLPAITAKSPENPKRKSLASHSASTVPFACAICKANHLLYQCPVFLKQSPSQRSDFIRKTKRCLNCFSTKHIVKACTSAHACRQCQKRHHSLLHFDSNSKSVDTDSSAVCPSSSTENQATQLATHVISKSVAPTSQILLATARVRVHSDSGRFIIVRALLDQGSVSTLMTESLAQCLRLPKIRRSVLVTGIGETQSVVRHAAQITITPASCDGPAYSTNALILRSLTKYLPSRIETTWHWNHIAGLTLADSQPMSSDPIDVIIGADLFGLLVLEGVRKGSVNEPTAQNTTLGWILSGPIASSLNSEFPPRTVHHGDVFEALDFNIRRFWEVEEIPHKSHLSPEELQCEEHFIATHSRTPQGRYVVRLPFKSEPPVSLGDSRSMAASQFHRLERRLQRDPKQASAYREFLAEYEQLGHMMEVSTDEEIAPSQSYYIPHHAVLREDSATTRLRVVFNASFPTTNGKSLNNHLLIGQKLQKDLPTVLILLRQHRYIYTADIVKMYRQILVDSRDITYQRILWRPSPELPLKEYILLTVTYGTASAPYLALRVLEQLAIDHGTEFPLAMLVLRRKTYVDDTVFGADDPVLARQTRDQLIALLAKGGFRLRKWASNSSDLLSDIDPSDHGLATPKVLQDDEQIKVLGISWNPSLDVFQFRVSIPASPDRTKRTILSTISKFFDPLGWATPVTITAKLFMQQLWALKYPWDEDLPSPLFNAWIDYHTKLVNLDAIKIQRWTEHGAHTIHSSLHGFCDASTKAFAAAVYLRLLHADGSVSVSIVIAKSKVAPLKTLSVPRLELNAAHLLVRLIQYVRNALQLPNLEFVCWTDSQIVLAWLKQSPSRWKTFVANRVSAIQSQLPEASWRHVPTLENPADCASRGVAPDALEDHPLWWSGPCWLRQSPECWPNTCPLVPPDSPLEQRREHPAHIVHVPRNWDLASRFSSWPKLLRVTAYLYRFLRKLRSIPRNEGSPSYLSSEDIQQAKQYWLKTLQAELFPQELTALQTKTPLPKASPLAPLNPYLDLDGLIRVGGRLRNSCLPGTAKNPIVLRSHPLLSQLIEHHHVRTLHGGPQLTLASLRNEFWILRARATIRSVLYKCVRCTRERAETPIELMGDLPEARVNRTVRAFIHTGIDYAGPIVIRTAPGRGHKSQKAYIALFICLTTKAIHLELVSDYSSTTFVAAYQRFVSRRGLPKAMYSDNGTTFQGADRELSRAYSQAIRDPNYVNSLVTNNTEWHFLPPAAPHFGGLWEAGVKSLKYHLKRCIGLHKLTFEDMTTLLCKIEACLNSRPISRGSDSLDDYQALTPGHFLVGTPLVAIPEPSVLDINEARLSRWQMIQRITEVLWRSWSNDYLHSLQQRPKWRVIQRLAKVGQIVLLRNAQAPPCQWELGRITACHPGDDGLTRVVTVKTHRSEYRRPIVKLCFLPVEINTEESKDSATAGGTTL